MPSPPFGMVPGASPMMGQQPMARSPFQRLDPMAARTAGGQMVAGFGYTPPTPQVPGAAPGMPGMPMPPGYMGSSPFGPGGGMGGGMSPGGPPGMGAPSGPSLGGMGYDGHPGIGPSQGIGSGPGGLSGTPGPTGMSGPGMGAPGGMGNAPSAPSMGGDWSAPDIGIADSYSDMAGGLGGLLGGPLGSLAGGLIGTPIDAAAMENMAPPGYSTNWGSVLMDATPVLGMFAGTSYANQVRKAIETAALSRTGSFKGGSLAGPVGNKTAGGVPGGLGNLGGVKMGYSGPGYGGINAEKSLARAPDISREGFGMGGGGANAKGGKDAGGGSKGKSAGGGGGGKNGGTKGGY